MKVYVLDLDGTLVNSSKPSLRERDIILSHIQSENRASLVSEAEKYTLEHPFDFPWVYKGLSGAFVEDSYTWRSAQVQHLWGQLKTDMSQDDFTNNMYHDATKGQEVELMKGAKGFVEHLFESGVQPVIVSNSSTEKGQKCCQKLQLDIPVYGNARKFAVEKSYPFSIDGKKSYAYRPEYERILAEIMSRYGAKRKDVTCVGDVLTLDLSSPYTLGMYCTLVENKLEDGFKTPEAFVEYAKRQCIEVVPSLESLII